ncbi:hypothetical protein [Burkholderia sp. BCC1972]|uniref:hypothetical protein n=1 Tax=Burkholderia sp. BCC1972 TaxID=2817438 RepID=UPI002ABE3C44|nr:hypothetical protein [Burkholderia sp. BCC1972]
MNLQQLFNLIANAYDRGHRDAMLQTGNAGWIVTDATEAMREEAIAAVLVGVAKGEFEK